MGQSKSATHRLWASSFGPQHSLGVVLGALTILTIVVLPGCRLKTSGDAFLANAGNSQNTVDTVTITSPTSNPYSGTATSQVVSGTCTNGYTVYSTVNNVTQTVTCSNSAFSFTYSATDYSSNQIQFYQTDNSSNRVSATTSFTWNLIAASNNTIALFRFDTATGATTDSNLYLNSYKNTLTNNSTSSVGTSPCGGAAYNQSRSFTRASSQFMNASNNTSQSLINDQMTIEGFVSLASNPGVGNFYAIASKMGASPNLGWEFGVTRSGANQALYFRGSLNGTSVTTVTGSTFNMGTNNCKHVAVTWDRGAVKLFYDGTLQGTGTIGSGTVSLYSSSADLRLGSANATNYLDGQLDEVRISKTLRYTGAFTAPTSPFTAD